MMAHCQGHFGIESEGV